MRHLLAYASCAVAEVIPKNFVRLNDVVIVNNMDMQKVYVSMKRPLSSKFKEIKI